MRISRRGVLAGAAAGGGLAIAFVLMPQRFGAPLAPTEGEAGFNAWLKIAADGVVTVAMPQCEMGQGVTTLLPQIVAMELGADWRQIAVEPAPPTGAYPNVPLAAHWAQLWRAARIRCLPAALPNARGSMPPPPGPRWPLTKARHARRRPPRAPC